jgi:hypothetical protein
MAGCREVETLIKSTICYVTVLHEQLFLRNFTGMMSEQWRPILVFKIQSVRISGELPTILTCPSSSFCRVPYFPQFTTGIVPSSRLWSTSFKIFIYSPWICGLETQSSIWVARTSRIEGESSTLITIKCDQHLHYGLKIHNFAESTN